MSEQGVELPRLFNRKSVNGFNRHQDIGKILFASNLNEWKKSPIECRNNMQILAQKQWSYVLMDDGRDWILTFLIGGVVETDVSIRLTTDEISKVNDDWAYLDTLTDVFKVNRNAIASREIYPAVWPTKK